MPSIALERTDVIIGVDTHKDEHVAVAIDGLGGLIGEALYVPATPTGYADLLNWALSLGRIYKFGSSSLLPGSLVYELHAGDSRTGADPTMT